MDIMASRALGLNNLILILFILSSCIKQEDRPPKYVNAANKNIQHISGITYVEDKMADGVLYELFPRSTDTACISEYKEGRQDGIYRTFYPGGKKKESRFFRKGWKEGEHRGWYASGKLAYIYHFTNDEFNGSLKEWTERGILFRDMNYENGYENGHQRIYYYNGKIKSNYVIKNGIRYGLLGTKNCVNVTDSIPTKPQPAE
jgi:antitoxin component YwqK of YwqJK toxin-antitoxin module